MFHSGIKLFDLFGFEIKLDFSWIFIAALVVWSLATGYFPNQIEGLSGDTYWAMAVVGMIGLFFSIVFHELAHSLVARSYGMKIRGITLFIFGGMAELEGEPKSPRAEFMTAIAGPIGSLVLAGAFYLVALMSDAAGAGIALVAVMAYLSFINVVVAVFNMIPAFPMDGGRVFRAVLWHYSGDMTRATRTAARGGNYFGIALIVLGITTAVFSNLVSGLWMVLIGLFIQRAAAGADFRSDVHSVFGDQPVGKFMVTNLITVEVGEKVQALVDDYFYRYYHDVFPVTDNGRLVGCVSARDVKKVDRKKWKTSTVGDIMIPCGPDNTITEDMKMLEVLDLMSARNTSRLMVVRGDKLVGIVTLKDLLDIITLKTQLEHEVT